MPLGALNLLPKYSNTITETLCFKANLRSLNRSINNFFYNINLSPNVTLDVLNPLIFDFNYF